MIVEEALTMVKGFMESDVQRVEDLQALLQRSAGILEGGEHAAQSLIIEKEGWSTVEISSPKNAVRVFRHL